MKALITYAATCCVIMQISISQKIYGQGMSIPPERDLFSHDTLSAGNKCFGGKVLDIFFDKDISRWSIRALANYKDNHFNLRNDNYELQFTPNNRCGIGFGFLNSKLLVDILFNLKTNKEEVTDRFDLQGNLMAGHSYISFQFQNYRGFNAKNTTIDDPGTFRRDIKSVNINLSYFYLFNSRKTTLSSIFSGVNQNYSSNGTMVGGVYADYHKIEADSSIVPASSSELFNDEAQIEKLISYGMGVNFGYSYFFALPANFLIVISAAPGIGINVKNIDTHTFSYKPSDLWQGSISANIQAGYNGPRLYVEFSSINLWYFSSFNYNNRGSTSTTKLKLAVGWKFRRQN